MPSGLGRDNDTSEPSFSRVVSFPKIQMNQLSTSDHWDREKVQQESLTAHLRAFYFPRESLFDLLDKHVQENSSPIFVLGESGIGKSAFLANWEERFLRKNPKRAIVSHYSNGGLRETHSFPTLRKVMEKLNECLNLNQRIPDKKDNLQSEFARLLYLASKKSGAVIVFDGIVETILSDEKIDFKWFPQKIPQNISFIFASAWFPEVPHFEERGWGTLKIDP
ncbi:ATP-binding protein, partial [bacterium]|nr:ATP-binding protein [bacterium]